MAGGGELAGGGRALSAGGGGLPGAGNELPLAAGLCCLLAALLRAGLAPASLKAAAKSWLPRRELVDAAGVGASGWTTSLGGGA